MFQSITLRNGTSVYKYTVETMIRQKLDAEAALEV